MARRRCTRKKNKRKGKLPFLPRKNKSNRKGILPFLPLIIPALIGLGKAAVVGGTIAAGGLAVEAIANSARK